MRNTATRPNILLICADGQRWDSLGIAGRFPNVTPNINTLAEQGAYFPNAFSTTAQCHPARASILTGRYAHRHGITANSNLPWAREKTWPASERPFTAVLAEAGYRTGHLGYPHWGKVPPPLFRYEVHKPPVGRFTDYGPDSYRGSPAPMVHKRYPLYATWHVDPEQTEAHYLTDQAIEFLRESSGQERPFMLHVDYSGPHYPYIVAEPFASLVDPDELEPWPNFHVRDEPERIKLWRRWFGVEGIGWEHWARALQYNLGAIAEIDHGVGRILSALDELGLAENTVVIYTADHGEMVGERGLLDKGPGGYDALYRVPLVMRYPDRIAPGTRCEALVQNFDLYPTLLEIAGVEVTSTIDSRSLFASLAGENVRDSVFCEYHAHAWSETPLRILRTPEWKLVYSGGDLGELYNMAEDPHEMNNLIHTDRAKEVLPELREKMLAWMERTEDPMLAGAKRLLAD